MSLYTLLLLGSVAIPFVLSFDKKLQFYKSWRYIFPAILLVAILYISFDVYLTRAGVWGFNSEYHSPYKLLSLPIEEWLFFIIIPYASLFLHYSLILYFPKIKLSDSFTVLITKILIVFFLLMIMLNLSKLYTVYILLTTIVFLVISLLDRKQYLNHFYLTFLVILIPFIAVNSILTGSFIPAEVVWYNNQENLSIRFLTIPVEDFLYAFSLLGLNLMLIEQFKRSFK